MEITGLYFDGGSARGRVARLWLSPGSPSFRLEVEGRRTDHPIERLTISERLADVPRRIHFPDGGLFETAENDAIDRCLEALPRGGAGSGGGNSPGLVHRLESRWRYAVPLLALGLVTLWLFFSYGIPAAADYAARVMPQSLREQVSNDALQNLENLSVLQASRLSDQTRERLTRRFQELEPDSHFDLRFRRAGEGMGPNAFALPSGALVLTDQLVRLSHHDDEIMAILGHEIGHVRRDHGLRTMLQSSWLSLVFSAIGGDYGVFMEGAAGFTSFLMELKYSRAFEDEADRFALAWLAEREIPPARFADIMARIAQPTEAGEDPPEILSSHPDIHERIGLFRQAAKAPDEQETK